MRKAFIVELKDALGVSTWDFDTYLEAEQFASDQLLNNHGTHGCESAHVHTSEEFQKILYVAIMRSVCR